MKSMFRFMSIALVALSTMVACHKDHVDYDGNGSDANDNIGYLNVAGLQADILKDTENFESASASRAEGVDINTFDVVITNAAGETVASFKYGERPTTDIELEAGDYIFKIQSGEVPGAAWDAPEYGTERAFKIVRNQTTTLSEIVCSLLQIKVSISYAPDLLERLGEKTVTEVTVGENTLSFSLTETRAAFFAAPQVLNNIDMCIKGSYAADKINFKPIEMTKQVRDVKAGQYSKVHFYIEHAAEGNINVGVTLQDWVTDEVIPCNVADQVSEEEWKDPSSGDDNEGGEVIENPITVEWIGYDMSQRVTIDPTTTGEIIIRAEKGIKELIVQIDSEVLIPALLGSIGLADVMNITYPEKSYDSSNPSRVIDAEVLKSALSKDFGFKICDEVINKTEVLFSITTFMGALNAEAGNHDFIFTVIDNDGVSKTEILKLRSTGN